MKNKKLLLSILGGALSGLAFIMFLIVKRNVEKLPKTATFMQYNLKSMSHKDLDNLMKNQINKNLKKQKIKVKVFDKIFSLSASQINPYFKTSEVFNYAKDKEKNKFPTVKYDKKKLRDLIEDLQKKATTNPTKYKYKKLNDTVLVKAGHHGTKIVIEDAIQKIEKSLNNLNFKPVMPKVTHFLNENSKINLQEIKKNIDKNVKDAQFKIVNNSRKYEEEVVGVNLDLKQAEKIVTNSEKGSYKIPLILTQPKETVQSLKNKHKNIATPNILGSCTTNFANSSSPGIQNRNHNIRVAAAGINGVILLPGEEFSFRETAGRQSGYVAADTYKNGKVVKDIGGGMCQVSSTLFNTALKANMQITQRRCHSKTVNYLPLGRDATYDKNGTDLRFINRLKNPVKIVAFVSNSSVTVNILGEKAPGENYNVSLNSHITGKTSQRVNAILNVTVTLNGSVVETKSFSSSYKN